MNSVEKKGLCFFLSIIFTTTFVVEENSLEKRYTLQYNLLSPKLMALFLSLQTKFAQPKLMNFRIIDSRANALLEYSHE